MAHSPFLTLGAVAFLFGFLLLAFNLTNEYLALKGEYPLTELPTINSLLRRIGASAEFNANYPGVLDWGPFLQEHFYRLGGLTLPHWLSSHFGNLHENPARPLGLPGTLMAVAGVVIAVVCLARALLSRYRVLLAALTVSGFVWALTFRYAVAFHDFMILYSIGIPLLLYSLAMLCLHRLSGGRLTIVLGVAAALVFAVSAFQVSRISHEAEAARFQEALIADFERIRHVTEPGDRVFVPVPDANEYLVPFAGARSGVNFYLSGRIIRYQTVREYPLSDYDFVLARPPLEPGRSLTPENRLRFLYRPGDYSASLRGMVENIGERDPVIRSGQDVYFQDGRLTYYKEECSHDDTKPRYLLHLTPANMDDLPDHRRRHGFDNLDFYFYEHGVRFDGKCLAQVTLPDYDLAEIHAGQFLYENGVLRRIWREEFRPPE